MTFVPVDRSKLLGRWGMGIAAGLTACLGFMGAAATFDQWDLRAKREMAYETAMHQEALATQAEIHGIETESARIQALRHNRVLRVESLMVSNYVLNDAPPVLNWSTATDPTQETLVYDQHRRCIGYAYGGVFYFIHHYPKACTPDESNPR